MIVLLSPRLTTYHISSTNNAHVAQDPDLSMLFGLILAPSSTRFMKHFSANSKPFIKACLGLLGNSLSRIIK